MSAVKRRNSGGGSAQEKRVLKHSETSVVIPPEMQPEELDRLYDNVYWLRQGIGLVLGLLFGIIPIRGATGFLGFISLNISLPFTYFNQYKKDDDVDDLARISILKEGFQPSFGVFLMVWILTYTIFHGFPKGIAEVVPPPS